MVRKVSSLCGCFIVLLLLAGCESDWQMNAQDAGVVVSGEWHSLTDDFPSEPDVKAVMKNTNEITVAVREVRQHRVHGEHTKRFFLLLPGEEKEILFDSSFHVNYVNIGFHLYTEQGVQIGFIRAVPVKK